MAELTAGKARKSRGQIVRHVGRSRNRQRRSQSGRHGGCRRPVIHAEDYERGLALPPRQHLKGDLAHDAERAPGAGHQLAKVETGDVLDHPASRFEGLAAPRHRNETEKMIASRPGANAARPGKIRRQCRPNGAVTLLAAKQRSVVDGFERKGLAVLGQQRFDVRKRGSGPRRQHQFLRFVQDDAGDLGQIQRGAGVDRTADAALRSPPHNLERFAGSERLLHRRFDVLMIARLKNVRHRPVCHAVPIDTVGKTKLRRYRNDLRRWAGKIALHRAGYNAMPRRFCPRGCASVVVRVGKIATGLDATRPAGARRFCPPYA